MLRHRGRMSLHSRSCAPNCTPRRGQSVPGPVLPCSDDRTAVLTPLGCPVNRTNLTRRNVGGSHTPGNHTAETGLPGWGGRTRTCKCHFEKAIEMFGRILIDLRNILGLETFPA